MRAFVKDVDLRVDLQDFVQPSDRIIVEPIGRRVYVARELGSPVTSSRDGRPRRHLDGLELLPDGKFAVGILFYGTPIANVGQSFGDFP